MRCLTLTQPWAQLVALGKKRIETRSWETLYRGPLAIHAAKGLGSVGGMRGLWELCEGEPFHSAIHPHMLPTALPLGAVVAVCDLVDCVATWPSWASIEPWITVASDSQQWVVPPPIDSDERAFGDYSPARFAWLLANVRMLPEPIPARGALSLWEWDAPAGL